ncbi:hypothetical protein ASZ90_014096 [hydrocarbon metagenome]|uniref:Uncharacterized protein n=1 Tax=hydrocarbon metagenome TaxID=938273 RepID=A0A0W8F5V2_9ZZZZ
MKLRAEEQYAHRSAEGDEYLLPDARPAGGISQTRHPQDGHAAADAGYHEKSEGPESQVPSRHQEVLGVFNLLGSESSNGDEPYEIDSNNNQRGNIHIHHHLKAHIRSRIEMNTGTMMIPMNVSVGSPKIRLIPP